MFAACSGGHYEVAKTLYTLGATLDRRSCEQSPDIIGRLLKESSCFLCEDESDNEDFTEIKVIIIFIKHGKIKMYL